jgi:hypothetical protein
VKYDRKELLLFAALIVVTCVQLAFSLRAMLDLWNALTPS